MDERALRKHCKRLLRSLGVRPPLQVNELCKLLGEHRGRPIRLMPHPLPVPGPFGLWVASQRVDYIFYQQETSKAHQDHIILHEVGHIVADHRIDEVTGGSGDTPLPGISPDSIRRALRRTSYDTAQEREAELVATIILEWASVLDRITPPALENRSARRVQTALSDRQGWL